MKIPVTNNSKNMDSFLSLVAQDLYKKQGGDLSRTAIVFPNKRASLFFNEHLAAQSQRPLWTPAYITISELFQQLSPLKKGDPIRLVCELYKVFREETHSEETLDDFYFWGELLISDFDDVDKNLVEADMLFRNLQDLKKIMEGNEYLTEEQVEAIQQFFRNFSVERRTELKERFISLWDKLGDIYHRYRERLTGLGIAYEGMMYRGVMEQMQEEQLRYDRYVFVGFNVLSRVEIALFKKLQAAGRAMFYWDYDRFYTFQPAEGELPYIHEAGEFILRNLQLFPNELSKELFSAFERPKRIRYIAAPTENAQARYLATGYELPATGPEKDTAIVLCNEALLLPILHSLPAGVEHVNITMGFPLSQTPVSGFVNALLELHTEGYRPSSGRFTFDAVITMLKHPYTRRLTSNAEVLERQLTCDNRFYPLPSELKQDAVLELLFTPAEGNMALCRLLTDALKEVTVLYRNESEELYDQLYRESLFKAYTLINRLGSLLESGDLEGIKTETFKRLLNRLLAAAGIPFHGEPAIGLQVMGVLETRNLDFRNLVIMSLNEGQLPKAEGDSSFIPYNLRRAFGMTTIEHKNAVYAYYFYRLIQRAEDITLLYNTSSDGLNRGEMSRFMLQLLVESPHDIEQYYLEAGQSPRRETLVCIEKSEEMLRDMYRNYDARLHPDTFLSPSALNTYLDCPLKFYYRYVKHLRVPDEVTAEIDSALFGTIFHRAAEMVYTELTAHGRNISKESLERLLKEDYKLQAFVDNAFKEKLFHVGKNEKPDYNGTQLINASVITSYLRQLLKHDLNHAPFDMRGMEVSVTEALEIDTPLGRLPLQIGGTVDRMDSKEDTLRIIDYKTSGSEAKVPESVEQLFTAAKERPGYVFQTFLYAAILCRKQPLKVAPALLYIQHAASESYDPVIKMGPARQAKTPITNFALIEDEFRNRLVTLLQEIFSLDTPFTQTEEKKRCQYCDFKRLCGR